MYEINKSIGFLLSKAYQRVWAIMRAEIETYDLTPPQFGLLAFLWQQDGLTQVELSEKGQIDRTTVGGLVDRLEKIGLVERRQHPRIGGHIKSTSQIGEKSWKALCQSAPVVL